MVDSPPDLSGSWENITYMPEPNLVCTTLSSDYPTQDVGLIGGAWVFCFNNENSLLLTKLRVRGIDIPGGKVEPEERTQFPQVHQLGVETAIRETYEETKVKIKDISLVGSRHFHSSGERPAAPKFPFPDCYFLYYFCVVDSLDPFVEEPQPNGSIDRLFFNEEDSIKEPKVQHHLTLYKRALQIAKEKNP